MDNITREFTGVWIPKHILEDNDLTAIERMLYAEINSFDKCFMSNTTFSQRLGCSERTVSRLIQNLINKKYIKSIGFDGRKRILKAILDTPNDEADYANYGESLDKMSTLHSQFVHIDNNIDNITISKDIGGKPTDVLAPKKEYGNLQVNELLQALTQLTPTGKLDGTVKDNRNFASIVVKKYTLETALKAVSKIKGTFYEGKINSARALFNHFNSILNARIAQQDTQSLIKSSINLR